MCLLDSPPVQQVAACRTLAVSSSDVRGGGLLAKKSKSLWRYLTKWEEAYLSLLVWVRIDTLTTLTPC